MQRFSTLSGLASLAVLGGLVPSVVRGQCSVAWNQNLPTTTGPVYAAIVWDDGSGGGSKLYFGGEIGFTNEIDRFQVIRWEGDHFATFGQSFHHSSGYASVNAFCVFNGELVAGGDFTFVDGVPCSRIAHWNGTAWVPFGAGIADEVHALTVYNGQLVAAGEVNARIEVWDGSTWQMLGTNISSGMVNALAVYNGQLIAGGYASPNGLCYLDGSTWKPLGGGVDGYVDALTVYNNELIAGGMFSHAGGVAASGIARWNGSRWAPLGSGVAGSYSWVRSFVNDGGNLIVGGAFTQAGGINSKCVAGWNGSAWFGMDGIDPGNNSEATARALAVWNGKIAAGGAFYAQYFPPPVLLSFWALGTSSCGGCADNSACDDSQFCNGVETCSNGTCVAGTSPCTSPLKCRESDDQCVSCLSNADCNDGVFCNGAETCSAAGTCQAGTPPCVAPSMCRESDDRCVSCLTNANCDDGLFCNGAETCSAVGTCQAGSNPCPGQGCDENSNVCVSSGPEVWLSFTASTSVPGVGTVGPEDIVARNVASGAWSMVLDGSDVGLSGRVIDGMARMADGSILLSFTAATTVAGMTGGPSGTTVDDSDIVRFIPTSLGANTAGAFVFYFDGSDVGLTTDDEDIDGIALTPSGQLVISTVGAVSANGVSGADTDLLLFNATSLGSVTAGTFSMYFDGSDVGLTDNGNEDVDAVDITSNGSLLLSTIGNFSVTGVSGANEDVIRFTPTQLGGTTSGSYTMYLDLSALGIATGADVGTIELKE